MFGRIKLRPTDTLYSKYIRKKNNFICERCFRFFLEGKGLEVSHFHGRRKESVRFDDENVDCLCKGCHRIFHESPSAYVAWKIKKLGQKKFDLLNVRAELYKGRDDKLDMIIIKKVFKNF